MHLYLKYLIFYIVAISLYFLIEWLSPSQAGLGISLVYLMLVLLIILVLIVIAIMKISKGQTPYIPILIMHLIVFVSAGKLFGLF